MAAFFLLVGLEIKREFLVGELASPRHAALPIAGAIGGMAVPAAIYLLINQAGPETRGWAIPMATDIAFALAALTLLAPTISARARVLLTALAVVDDIGAIAVIALFYSHALNGSFLLYAMLVFVALIALNLCQVRRLVPYLALGGLLWSFTHASGMHATIAGVLLAWVIPTRASINAEEFSTEARIFLDDFQRTETGDYVVLTSKGQQEALLALGRASNAVTAPLLRLEHGLHPFVAFIVMPLFALSNAGVSIQGSVLNWRVLVGIAAGLTIGKPLGIMAATYGFVRLTPAHLPETVTWRTLLGCASIGGIGFTMSLFVADLAFEGTPLLDSAKLGILTGSLGAGAVASVVFRRWKRRIAPSGSQGIE